MTKVIYCEWSTDFFLDVAERLHDKYNWEPCLWVSIPELECRIKKMFPNVGFQSTYDAMKGRYLYYQQCPPLDKCVLEKMSEYEPVALKMMDRMDPDFSFSYNDRVDLYCVMLRWWKYMLEQLEPDLVVFPYSPHSVYDYVLYSLCVEYCIETFMFEFTSIDGLIYPMSRFDRGSLYVDSRYEDLLFEFAEGKLGDILVSDKVDSYLSRVQGSYQEAIPVDMKEWIIDPSMPKSMFRKAKDVIHLAGRMFSPTPNYLKQKGKNIQDSEMSGLEYRLHKFRANLYKKNLRNYYDNLARNVNLRVPYIYVALHYQPERSTSPSGGVYANQLLMIDMLSAYLPVGWNLYVKEHPAQLDKISSGERSRTREFYSHIDDLGNAFLVPMSYTSFDLIDSAVATATITGTSGWESILRGKPAIVFGRPWYSRCEGVLFANDESVCREAMLQLKHGFSVDRNKVRLFVCALEEVCSRGYVVESLKSVAGVTYQENVDSVYNTIVKYFDLKEEENCLT